MSQSLCILALSILGEYIYEQKIYKQKNVTFFSFGITDSGGFSE